MEEQEFERIERYLRRELPDAAQSAFEQEMSADPALQQQVELHRLALQAIRLEGRAAMKARFRQRQLSLPDAAKKNANRRWRWAAALLGVGLLAVVAFWLNNRESQHTQVPQKPSSLMPEVMPQNPPTQTKPTETSPSNPPANTNEAAPKPAPPIAAGKPDVDKLFAENFKPYVDEVFESTARTRAGDENLPPFEQFVDFYMKSEHEKALAVYEQINPAVKNSDNVLFFKANSLLATGKTGEAAALLQSIIEHNRSRHLAEAKWYLALSLLKKGELKTTEKRLDAIAADESSPRRSQAEALLQKVRRL